MDEPELRKSIEEIERGALDRRSFVQTLVGLGLTAPVVSRLLGAARPARAQSPARPSEFTPARRGGGGLLRLLWWQAPTLLNPYFANGTKDQDGSRLFYEPLASFDPDGILIPILAAEIPTLLNGGVARDGMSVTWRLKKGVVWHDGRPFSADDVVFNWEYAADPATAAVWSGPYEAIARIEKLDSHAVKVVFKKPTPFWAEAFCGSTGQLIPKHLFEPFKGVKSREAPANLRPVGTGPYRIADFKPGDVIRAELNPTYHLPNWPFFDTVELKGGGDAVSAARAVIQTGEYDFAWNLQVEDDVLRRMEQGGKGRLDISPAGNIEHVQVNFADPWTEVDGERASAKSRHPFLSDLAVRQALNLLVDRANVQEQIYGRGGTATANFLNAPAPVQSRNTRWEFNVDRANAILDQAGWRRGADGIRVKDGRRLRMLYQTSINAPRQKTQAIVKQACAKAGIDVELKSVVASVFFSSDAANPDTYPHFQADLQMYNTTMSSADPQVFMAQFTSWEIASRENKWSGRNVTRWRSDEYDRAWRAAETEMDAVKRAALFVKLNDLLIQSVVVIPIVWRPRTQGVSHKLKGTEVSGWDSTLARLATWYREA